MKIQIAIILTGLGIPGLLRKKFKEKFPGLAFEVKFGENKDIKLSSFLEIPEDHEMIIIGNNPFIIKGYATLKVSQNFYGWVAEEVEILTHDFSISFSSFEVEDESDFYFNNHSVKLMDIFNKFGLFKVSNPNMPIESSFDPYLATDSVFLE